MANPMTGIIPHPPPGGTPVSQSDGGTRGSRCTAWLRGVPPWILLALATSPTLVWFIRRLDDGSDEPYGLIPLGIALLAAIRDRKSIAASDGSRTAGLIFLFLSACSTGSLPPMVRAGFALAGLAAWCGLHRRPGVIGLLALSLPVIASLQFYAGYPLRLAAADGAVRLLQCTGLVASREGVEILIGGATVSVDPACSGVRMIWHACVVAMALTAYHRCGWRHTLLAGAAAAALVVPANAARAAWLTVIESGKLGTHPPGHDPVGVACFAAMVIPLAWWISRKARPNGTAAPASEIPVAHRIVLLLAAALAPILMARRNPADHPTYPCLPLPATFSFNGIVHALEPLPPSPEELAFAKSFPGSLSGHRWGDKQVILRQTGVPTRKLHPSRDCLRAAGYHTTDAVVVQTADGGKWSTFQATRRGEMLTVHERVVSQQDGTVWTDVQAWYWSALDHPLNGPWRAETVIGR